MSDKEATNISGDSLARQQPVASLSPSSLEEASCGSLGAPNLPPLRAEVWDWLNQHNLLDVEPFLIESGFRNFKTLSTLSEEYDSSLPGKNLRQSNAKQKTGLGPNTNVLGLKR